MPTFYRRHISTPITLALLSPNKANEYIEKNKDNRFCIWVGLLEPHAPFNFPIEYADRIDLEEAVVPEGTAAADDPWVPLIFKPLTAEDKKGIIRSYYTSVTYLDKNVGLILKKRESVNRMEDILLNKYKLAA